MLVLNESDIDTLIDIDFAIAAMRDLMDRTRRGDIVVIPRQRLEDGPMYLAMMAAVDRQSHLFSAKLYTTGTRRGSFKVLLWDSISGSLLAMLDANRLGQLRTGAISAVATDRLSRPDADTLLLIGTGYQAETQVLAISRVRSLKTVYVHSRHAEHRAAFLSRMRPQIPENITLIPVDTVQRYAERSHIIVTATTAHDPVIKGQWLRPGTHVNAVGSNHPTDHELDWEAVQKASMIITDHVEGARLESGDLILGLAESDWNRVTSLDQCPPRSDPEAITLFISQGIESEDLVMAQYVLQRWSQHQIP
ncbi:MAG: ornithine cyclodeaminase family protein [Firmicutes bacterium]|jgi:ornithine cyclodeaminase/alanine dehydrogenase-like protein (mu-crystallin family)|nr:ornithine cyclodeaminase family protein [Bacillota bacterium]